MQLGHVLYELGTTVGYEGIVGISLFMGGETTSSRAVVHSAGHAYRVPGQYLKEEFFRAGPFQRLLLRYTQALITQMGQTAVCNRHHSVEQQLCRWLLMSLDRLPSNELQMTQELITNMLGVRCEGVTESAGRLPKLGLIHYNRGHITVIDRLALEAHACECYAVVKKEFDRLCRISRLAEHSIRLSSRACRDCRDRCAAPAPRCGSRGVHPRCS